MNIRFHGPSGDYPDRYSEGFNRNLTFIKQHFSTILPRDQHIVVFDIVSPQKLGFRFAVCGGLQEQLLLFGIPDHAFDDAGAIGSGRSAPVGAAGHGTASTLCEAAIR